MYKKFFNTICVIRTFSELFGRKLTQIIIKDKLNPIHQHAMLYKVYKSFYKLLTPFAFNTHFLT